MWWHLSKDADSITKELLHPGRLPPLRDRAAFRGRFPGGRATCSPPRATQASPPRPTPLPPLRDRAAFRGRFHRGRGTCSPPRATQASPPCSTPLPPLRDLETWQPPICV